MNPRDFGHRVGGEEFRIHGLPHRSRNEMRSSSCIHFFAGREADFCATVNKSRKASFTACASGNAAATSGASRTRFVPERKRAAYFPRTPLRINDASYSGRWSSRPFASAFFFIDFPFTSRRLPGADDPYAVLPVRVRNEKHASSVGC